MPSNFENEMALFADALEIADPAERNAFLDRICADQPDLRARLEQLLEASISSADFFTLTPDPSIKGTLSAEADVRLHARLDLNSSIGRYKLVQRLGEGGCGVVYLAEQQEPVRRPVALKIIRLGMDTENVIARFNLERQSLALMDHPNIARVFDAGATETGRPYFVMEVVQGVKITDYCDRHRLDIAARLELFILVCQAIQHAHQKGVIHLDIKPSNILITVQDGQPTPKLIDFGIAKATGGHLVKPLMDSDGGTTGASLVGTPSYMSPEQASTHGADVDTRGDIYGLGVLLCELLTGLMPFAPSPTPQEGGVEELRRIIRERCARSPSALVAALGPVEREKIAALRQTPTDRLEALLRDDLDHIVLKALAPDRRDRYETANALAMDIRRWLGHEPVIAHPPGRRYRLRKLIRRNRGVFVAGTLVALALIAGFGASTWLFLLEREARREQARLRDEAESARANEVVLRQQAETREKISQAAVHLSHNHIELADALVADLPLARIPPSLECANLMSALGHWHALADRWGPAAARFEALTPAITRIDPSDSDQVSRNLVHAAAALCQNGDRVAYERFRNMIVSRFSRTNHPVVAEQIIKASLLMSADAETVAQLTPLAKLLSDAISRDPSPQTAPDPYMSAWRALSLALLAYREGDYAGAIGKAQLCLAYPSENPPRSASAQAIIALSSHHLGDVEEMQFALATSRRIVSERFRQSLVLGDSLQGFWSDWVIARLLLAEASELIAN